MKKLIIPAPTEGNKVFKVIQVREATFLRLRELREKSRLKMIELTEMLLNFAIDHAEVEQKAKPAYNGDTERE